MTFNFSFSMLINQCLVITVRYVSRQKCNDQLLWPVFEIFLKLTYRYIKNSLYACLLIYMCIYVEFVSFIQIHKTNFNIHVTIVIFFFRSLAQLSLLFGNVVRGLSAGARVFEFINTTSTIPLSGGKKIPFHSLRGDIKFQNVRFSYPTRAEQVWTYLFCFVGWSPLLKSIGRLSKIFHFTIFSLLSFAFFWFSMHIKMTFFFSLNLIPWRFLVIISNLKNTCMVFNRKYFHQGFILMHNIFP